MIPAAQYIRVSTDQQQHSLAAQAAQIAEFATAHGYAVVASYEDRGRSGLRLKGRTALQGLLADVLTGAAPFKAILVQDISRWGRFQDTDEAAHYEYVCREAGVEVRYCAEPFDDLPGRSSDLIKAVKRLMAADFSRELSDKVRKAQYRHARAGYKMGGVAGYGLRRAIVDAEGQVTAVLESGQQRLLRGDRITYVPGPEDEVATVRRIFRMFVDEGFGLNAIADTLNAEQVRGENGRAWGPWAVGNLLANPKYAGGYRFGRRRRTLDGRRPANLPDSQVEIEGAFQPLVPQAWLAAAARKRRQRMLFLPPDEIWRRLQDHAAQGRAISHAAIALNPDLPSPRTCVRSFGPCARIAARLGDYRAFLPGQIDRPPAPRDGTPRPSPESPMPTTFTTFIGAHQLAAGDLETVALAAHATQDRQTEMPIVFDDATGQVVDLDLRGSPVEVVRRLLKPSEPPETDTPRGRGRPKLGVTAREITLLPRHWAWLQSQPGGASAVLRRLVEQAQQDNAEADALRLAQTATYRVMQALAGHLRGYEDALRALYAGDSARFTALVLAWPEDVSAYVLRLSGRAFPPTQGDA